MKTLAFFLGMIVLSMVTDPVRAVAGDNPRSVKAVRVATPPRMDGQLDDAVWKLAEPATDFIQREPDEGRPASERSEIRVVYDDEALYFGCVFYDSEPQKIVSRLTRRDNEIEADEASIRIDSYHDHQTGYEFTFSAAGVKIDKLQFDDADKEDDSWDPVWDLETHRLPDGSPAAMMGGWSAEVKIPFRILRYHAGEGDSVDQVWGINFLRYISRRKEWDRWAFTPKSQSGFISRFGHLTGLRDLPVPRQLEVMPFIVGRQSYEPASALRQPAREFLGSAGLDVRYGLASNFTLDATINPDFGQVEADPAVLNLSTFETFYPEKRPFFIEGTQIIRLTTFGGDFGPGMFYSRRVGRGISVDEVNTAGVRTIEEVPQTTTILGAAKISGRTNSGLSIGMLQAMTQEEKAIVVDTSGVRSGQILEPFAHYSVIRLKQDVLDGSHVGMILTSVEKRMRYPAFTNGYDWDLKFEHNTYQLNGFLALSRSTTPDNERNTGSAGKLQFSRIAGEHWLWSVSGDFTSKRYNINDIGFFFRPNDYGPVATVTYKEDVPAQVVRSWFVTLFLHERRNFDGVNLYRETNLNSTILFANYWSMNASAGRDGGEYDDRETRGNGLYGRPRRVHTSTYLYSDDRKDVVMKIGQRFLWDSKSEQGTATEVGLNVKPFSWVEFEANYEYIRVRNEEAWVDNVDVGGSTASIFGDRSTVQHDMRMRSTITFTRDLTLQVYGQVFLAKGHYDNLRQLVGTSGFAPYGYAGSPDFNRQSLNTNLVLRWEYHPGSTLFLVWSQARRDNNGNYFTAFGNDFNDTFRIPPHNVLVMKLTYLWNL